MWQKTTHEGKSVEEYEVVKNVFYKLNELKCQPRLQQAKKSRQLNRLRVVQIEEPEKGEITQPNVADCYLKALSASLE